jgi:ABC-2 type transport system ATP-binding protein
MGDELAIEASGLVKSYGGVRVLAGVDLRVPRGSVFALLGPSGSWPRWLSPTADRRG